MTIRTGLYAGTFYPITNGHIDIVQLAVKLVDRLVTGVAINRDKSPLFSLEERVEMVHQETVIKETGLYAVKLNLGHEIEAEVKVAVIKSQGK